MVSVDAESKTVRTGSTDSALALSTEVRTLETGVIHQLKPSQALRTNSKAVHIDAMTWSRDTKLLIQEVSGGAADTKVSSDALRAPKGALTTCVVRSQVVALQAVRALIGLGVDRASGLRCQDQQRR